MMYSFLYTWRLLCHSTVLCSALKQPGHHHPFVWAWIELYTSVSTISKERKAIFLQMGEGALKCLSEVTKGLNFILVARAPAMAAKGKSPSFLSLCGAGTSSKSTLTSQQSSLEPFVLLFWVFCLLFFVFSEGDREEAPKHQL